MPLDMKYNSNLTDAQFNLIAKYLPKVKKTRPRKYSEKELLNAILYILVSGCQWRQLPSDFPPWESVYKYFRKLLVWKDLDRLLYLLNRRFRKISLKKTSLPAYILITDSQSVRATELLTKKIKGYDGNKKIHGLKRFLLVDAFGLVWYSWCSPANASEKTEVLKMLRSFSSMKACPKEFKTLLADKGFESWELEERLETECNLKLYAMKSTKRLKNVQTNQITPYDQEQINFLENRNKQISLYRWIVEQAFSFLDKCRRLIVCYERKTRTHLAFVKLAFIRLLVRRLA
jgi:putative transposase